MFALTRALIRALVVLLAASVSIQALAAQGRFGLGSPASAEAIAGWDIDVRPDGLGLPEGAGSAAEGEPVYQAKCAACHGEFGEAVGRYPVLMGGTDTLASEDPVKTIGSYWPYASTVFDYVKRAMPFGHAQSLSDDETYAITAYLLYLNDLIEEGQVLNRSTLLEVKMPNRVGFVKDSRPQEPKVERCMSNCRSKPTIAGRARQLDVTPDDEAGDDKSVAAPAGTGDPVKGKDAFAQCSACHSLQSGEHRVGPSLHGIVGQASAAVAGFPRYSAALKGVGITWDEATLAAFLRAPQEVIPGTTMPFAGIQDAAVVADLVAFLQQAALQ